MYIVDGSLDSTWVHCHISLPMVLGLLMGGGVVPKLRGKLPSWDRPTIFVFTD